MPTRSQSIERRAGERESGRRTAVLILGMHRSGTSAVARLLNLRGAALGRDLLPAKQDNERGFWENRAILELHESVLRELGLNWHELVLPPPTWLQSAPARRFVTELPATLAAQFGDVPLFAVKDPRLSRFAPLWIEVLAGIGIRPAFCFTVRHPDEVAASLARRDGLSAAHAQVLWLRHLVDGERATRGHARVFVHYEHLLADWRRELDRIGKQLAVDWPPEPPEFAAAVDGFLAPSLRHHHAENTVTPAIVARAYERACAATTGNAVRAMFDDSEYDDLMQLIGPLCHEFDVRQRAQCDEHAAEIDRARAAFAAKDAELDAARGNIETLVRELDRARAAFATKDAEIEAARGNIAALVRELDQARAAFTIRDAEIEAARSNIDALVREIDQARGVIESKDAEIDAARKNIDALVAEIAIAREAFGLKTQELAAVRADTDNLLSDLEQVDHAHWQQEQELSTVRAHVESLLEGVGQSGEIVAAKDAEIDAARRNIDDLVAQIDAARRTIDWLVAEVDTVRHSRWFRLGRALRVLGPHKA